MAETGDNSVSAEGIAAAARAAGRKGGPAPVHLWNPPYCGELDIVIRADGSWWHEGSPIGRPAMVRLFASILKREDGRFFLVTPVEKVGIAVDDAPLHAIDLEVEGEGEGQRLTFVTLTGDAVTAGPANPIRLAVDGPSGEPSPYVHVRRGLEARIDRKTFYRLVERATDHDGHFGVWSDGVFFGFLSSDELERLIEA